MAITTNAQPKDDGAGDTVEAYIARQAESVRPILERMREAIRTAAPDATEKIAWHMPSYWQGKNLINFAAFTKHVSIFPGAEAIEVFADKLTGYTTGKGTVQFQLDEPIPYDLIADIVRWKVAAISQSLFPASQGL